MRVSIENGLKALKVLDFSQVKRKLMESEPEGRGWDQGTADEAEKWYRRYLEVCLRYPGFPAVPNGVIDAFWHQHILDTRAYARDCQVVFGDFLHHYPYFGLNGDADKRDDAFVETNKHYRTLFGEDCTSMKKKVECCGIDGQAELCMRAEDCNTSACRADDPHAPSRVVELASGCGHSGSGTGCGQGCSRGMSGQHPFAGAVSGDFGRPYATCA